MYYLSLYVEFIRIRLKSSIEHRGAFLLTALVQALSYGANFLIVWVMVNQFQAMGQWQAYEVMFLSALNLCSYGLAGFFFYAPSYILPRLVQTGEFDEALTKPLSPLMYLVSKNFLWGYLSHTGLSVVIMCVCLSNLNIAMTAGRIAFLIVTIISGGLIQSAIFLFSSVPSFWLVKNDIGNVLWNLRSFVQYPITIYHKAVQVLLTIVVPFAFISFYPAQYFLGKDDFGLFHPVFQYLAPAVGLALFLAALLFWRFGVKHYNSTGS